MLLVPSMLSLLLVLSTTTEAAPTVAVSLLTDHISPSPNTTIGALVRQINQKNSKKSTFYFGSTLASGNPSAWNEQTFEDNFNLAVAENSCKWEVWEPSPGKIDASQCVAIKNWANARNIAFRGHNTFWHNQRPGWLVSGSYNQQQLAQDIIPRSVTGAIEAVGKDVLSWDVLNEIWSGSPSSGATENQCVVSANQWPSKSVDGQASSANLWDNTDSFVDVALNAAGAARKKLGSKMKFFINEFNIAGPSWTKGKTDCAITTLSGLKSRGVPIDGLGIQSHWSTTYYPVKSDSKAVFASLANLGMEGAITELDVSAPGGTSDDARLQAAIYGDLIDVCLYASNCHEFLVWDTRDDESWLGADAKGTLFDASGKPKLAYFEIVARLENYIAGKPEPCSTASGTGSCKV